MDPSISDILASITRAYDASTSLHANGQLLSDSAQQQQDLGNLTRAWTAERVAPELLPYPTELMDRIMRRIRKQIETIEDRTARMDAGTSFTLVVMQTELERFKFLVRSFVRARIAKIDAHPLHLLSLSRASSVNTPTPLLSPSELQYLTTHAALVERHYTSSFLSSFPAKLRRLDDRAGAGGVGMVEGPDLETAVFVRCLGVANDGGRGGGGRGYDFDDDDDDGEVEGQRGEVAFGAVEVSCGYTAGEDEDRDMGDGWVNGRRGDGGERIVRMRRGEVWLVRWSGVRDAVARGECELI